LCVRLIPQGANIPCTPEAEQALYERDALVVPDFIANALGAICASIGYFDGTQCAAFDYTDERIRADTHAVLEQSRRDKVLSRAKMMDDTRKSAQRKGIRRFRS
jgi:glutamate dehydrogenase/leucine dehydrogenase